MPEIVKEIVEEINAGLALDPTATAAFTEGLRAGISLRNLSRETAEKEDKKND